jgi:hypothetical protein
MKLSLGFRFFASVLASVTSALAVGPFELGSRLELMVDRHLIDRLDGTSLKLNPPRPAGVAIDRQTMGSGAHWNGHDH